MFSRQPVMEKYVIVDTLAKLTNLANKLRRVEEFAFDTETNTLQVNGPNKDFRFVGMSISWGAYNNYYIPVGHRRHEDVGKQLSEETVVHFLKPCFEREDVRIIGWNLRPIG